MDAYYLEHSLPYFAGHNRQRGSGIGALVGGIARFALPFFKNIIFPAVKRIGREIAIDAVPELLDVATKRKTPRQAFENTARKTYKRQTGTGTRKKRVSKKRKSKRKVVRKTTATKTRVSKRKAISQPRNPPKRSRLSFFSNINQAPN